MSFSAEIFNIPSSKGQTPVSLVGVNSNVYFISSYLRKNPNIDSTIANVYKNAIKNLSHSDMNYVEGTCPLITDVAAHCGNRRGALTECRCTVLNRKQYPHIRQQYEDKVINTILQIIGSQKGEFRLNLAIFASGLLLGESILAFRLFDTLKNNGRSGSITISLIDTVYTYPLNSSVENAMKQFLEEMSKTLPSKIKLKTNFFNSDTSYISYSNQSIERKHDLLIGADVVGLHSIMAKIDKEAGANHHDPIVLDKDEEEKNVHLCTIGCDGELENCSDPSIAGNSAPIQKYEDRNFSDRFTTTEKIGLGLGLGLGVTIVVGSIFFGKKGSRSK